MRLAIMLRHFDVSANSTTMLRHFDTSVGSMTTGSVTIVRHFDELSDHGLTKQGNSEMANLEMGEIREQFF